MASISVALIVAAMEQHPELYDEPVDIFRGVCEGITLLLVTLSFLTELYHIYLYVNAIACVRIIFIKQLQVYFMSKHSVIYKVVQCIVRCMIRQWKYPFKLRCEES